MQGCLRIGSQLSEPLTKCFRVVNVIQFNDEALQSVKVAYRIEIAA